MSREAVVLVVILAASCEQKHVAPPAIEVPDAVTRTRSVDVAGGVDTAEAAPTPSIERPAGCEGLQSAQLVKLEHLEGTDGAVGSSFRFGTEKDSLRYEVEWVGDLNDDGASDRVARRDTKGAREVRLVLIGCGEGYALGWAGVSSRIDVLDEEIEIGDVPWRSLRIHSNDAARAMSFGGDKYRPAR